MNFADQLKGIDEILTFSMVDVQEKNVSNHNTFLAYFFSFLKSYVLTFKDTFLNEAGAGDDQLKKLDAKWKETLEGLTRKLLVFSK